MQWKRKWESQPKPVELVGFPFVVCFSCFASKKNFKQLFLTFEHTVEARDSSAEMQGRGRNLSKKLKAYKCQLHLHLMWDILDEISKISLIFQQDLTSLFRK